MVSIILISLFIIGLVWIPAPHLFRKLGERKLKKVARANRSICLTFDDGPGDRLTPQLLELLGRYDASATFFLLGQKLDKKNIIESLAAKGHEIECHGYDHVNAWYSTPTKTWKDMAQALRSFQDRGLDCQLIRPPYGKITCLSILQAILWDKKFSWWTLDSTDTNPELGSIDLLISKLFRAGGGVVLLHDFDNDREQQRVDFVLEATEAILEFAIKNDYKLIALGELLALD